MSVWADFVLYAIQKGFGNAPKLSCPSSSWSSWPASSAPSSWLEFEYLSGEPARCHLKGSAARKVEQQGGQEKERRRRCRQEKVSTHCGWGQRAQLAWQPDPPSRLPSSQPSLLLNCSADHLNCSANQQTSLKQFDLVRCWRYIIHAPPRMLLLSFQLKVRRGRIRGREVCRRENCRQLC